MMMVMMIMTTLIIIMIKDLTFSEGHEFHIVLYNYFTQQSLVLYWVILILHMIEPIWPHTSYKYRIQFYSVLYHYTRTTL